MAHLRTGIVGCGLFGESHAAALQGMPDVEILSVFDLDRDKAYAFAQRFGIPKVAASLAELLEHPLDTVHVVTPEAQHREVVVAALQSGKHVLVEKPFATSLEDCDSMTAAAKQSARILMVGAYSAF
jgi:predicted dehydrogenase